MQLPTNGVMCPRQFLTRGHLFARLNAAMVRLQEHALSWILRAPPSPYKWGLGSAFVVTRVAGFLRMKSWLDGGFFDQEACLGGAGWDLISDGDWLGAHDRQKSFDFASISRR